MEVWYRVTAWKVSKCRVFSVKLRIQSEYRKIRARKNSVFGHFSRSECFYYLHGKVLFQSLLCLRTAAFWKKLGFFKTLLFKSLLPCELWTCLPCQRISLHLLFIFRCCTIAIVGHTKNKWRSLFK